MLYCVGLIRLDVRDSSRRRTSGHDRTPPVPMISLGGERAVLHDQRRGLPARGSATNCRPGSAMPRRSSAVAAVANSFRTSRGGRLIQRVIATHPAGLEAIRGTPPSLRRCTGSFRTARGVRRRRGERVEQRNLDEIEALVMPRDESTRLADVHAHAGAGCTAFPNSRRTGAARDRSTCGFSSTASTRAHRGRSPAARRRRLPRRGPARAVASAGDRAAQTSGSRGMPVAPLVRRSGRARSGPSPSTKTPSCGGGSAGALRLNPGACRNGTCGPPPR